MQRETENQNNFSNVYTLLDLDEPSAKSIRDLDTIMGELQGHCAEQHQQALLTETLHQRLPTPPMGWCETLGVCLASGSRAHWAALLLSHSCNQGLAGMFAYAMRRALALIKIVSSLAGEDFEDRVGSAPETSPDHLRNGLWAASQLISAGSSRANKRVLIFTRDENPAGSGSKAGSHRHCHCPSHAANSCLALSVWVCAKDSMHLCW